MALYIAVSDYYYIEDNQNIITMKLGKNKPFMR